MVKNGAVLCVVLIACGDASVPKHSDAGARDAGVHAQGTRDGGWRDAATGADAMLHDQPMMSATQARPSRVMIEHARSASRSSLRSSPPTTNARPTPIASRSNR